MRVQSWRPGCLSWVGKIPWGRKWQPTPACLPRKSHGQRSLAGYSPWGWKRVGHDLATSLSVLFKNVWQCVQAHLLRSRMLTCTSISCVNTRESSLGMHVHLSSSWSPCSQSWPSSTHRWIFLWSPLLHCSMILALTCILASPAHCLSSFSEILPIPGHVLAKTVLLQICPVACSNPALHTHSPVPHSRYTLKGSVFQTLVTCIYYFWHSQYLIIQLLP